MKSMLKWQRTAPVMPRSLPEQGSLCTVTIVRVTVIVAVTVCGFPAKAQREQSLVVIRQSASLWKTR